MNRVPRRAAAPARAAGAGQVRIIGGRWRGTKLPVADAPGLRPSADRVRETLFNWLMPVLPGARCVDLFAGSGALGFEAGSRGAARVLMIERDPRLAASLQASAARLQAGGIVEVRCADALAVLAASVETFDIAFVDPPFAGGMWEAAFAALAPRLAASAHVHVESPVDALPAVPPDWQLHREGRTREVRYAVYRRGGP